MTIAKITSSILHADSQLSMYDEHENAVRLGSPVVVAAGCRKQIREPYIGKVVFSPKCSSIWGRRDNPLGASSTIHPSYLTTAIGKVKRHLKGILVFFFPFPALSDDLEWAASLTVTSLPHSA